MAGKEHRRQQRVDLTKLAFAKEGEQARGGLIRDISAVGAYIEFQLPMGRVEHHFQIDDKIDLILEDETVLSGRVARTDEIGIAIAFDPDAADQFGFVEAMVEAELEAEREAEGGAKDGAKDSA